MRTCSCIPLAGLLAQVVACCLDLVLHGDDGGLSSSGEQGLNHLGLGRAGDAG